MMARRYLLALIGGIALQCVVRGDLLGADDVQTCMELCSGCDGIATFEDGRCQCHIADDDQKGAECMGRMKRHAQELGLNLVSCEVADAERPARCLLSSRRRLGTLGDANLVAKYFMKGGALGGHSLLGAANPETDSTNPMDGSSDPLTSAPNPSSTNGLPSANPATDSMVGAPHQQLSNQLGGMLGHFLSANGLLGAWNPLYNPQNIVGVQNGYMGYGPGMQNFVGVPNQMRSPGGLIGQQNPMDPLSGAMADANDGDISQTNTIGGLQQSMVGDSLAPRFVNGLESPQYPGNTGNVGAPNARQFQGLQQQPSMPLYPYNPNSVLGAANSQSGGPYFQGGSPYPMVGAGDPFGMPYYYNPLSTLYEAPNPITSPIMEANDPAFNQVNDGSRSNTEDQNPTENTDKSDDGDKTEPKVAEKPEKPVKKPTKKPTKEPKLVTSPLKKYRDQKLGAGNPKREQEQMKRGNQKGSKEESASDHSQPTDSKINASDPNNNATGRR